MSEEQQTEKASDQVPRALEPNAIPPMEVGLPAAWAVWCEIDERAQAHAELVRLRGESPIAATRRQVAAFEHLGLAASWAKGMSQALIAAYSDHLQLDVIAYYMQTLRESYAQAWGEELVQKMEASWMQAFHRACTVRREGLEKVEARRVAFESSRAPVLEGDVDDIEGDVDEEADRVVRTPEGFEARGELPGGELKEDTVGEGDESDEGAPEKEPAPELDVHGLPKKPPSAV